MSSASSHLLPLPMVKDLSRDQIIKMMVGHSLDQQFPPRTHTPGEEILRAEHMKLKSQEVFR